MRPDLVPGKPLAAHRPPPPVGQVASWQPAGGPICTVGPMTTSTTATASEPPRRRRAAARSAHERLFVETAPMRRSGGVAQGPLDPRRRRGGGRRRVGIDPRRCHRLADAVRRRPLRGGRPAPLGDRGSAAARRRSRSTESADPAERAVEVTDAERQVRQLLSTVPATVDRT